MKKPSLRFVITTDQGEWIVYASDPKQAISRLVSLTGKTFEKVEALQQDLPKSEPVVDKRTSY